MRLWPLLWGAMLLQAQSPEQVMRHAHSCLTQADLVTVRSLVEVESHFQRLALNINYPEQWAKSLGYRSGFMVLQRQPRTEAEAVAWIRWFEEHHWTLSVGLLQVNIVEAARLGITGRQLLDPCLNLQTGWRIFVGHYQRAAKQYGEGQFALQAAFSAYNTGSFAKGFQNGYVQKVLRAAQR